MKNKILKKITNLVFLPPPNITGKLHIGHALNFIIIDIIIRKNKMMGHNIIWIPGFDHAGISTQIIIEKYLEKYGLTKNNIKKKKFLKFILKWKKFFETTIIKQIKKFNILINWNLKYFTKNNIISKLINKIFINLYKKGLIYKKISLINWDPLLLTAISDLEIKKTYNYKYIFSVLYPFYNKNGYLYIINNLNYFKNNILIIFNKTNNIIFIKKKLYLPLTNKILPLILKGLLKKIFNSTIINPLYNYNDYNLIKKFKLPLKILINFFFFKKKFNKIKKKKLLILNFKKFNLIKFILNRKLIIYKSDRTDSNVKLKLKNQWFINMNKAFKIFKNKKKLSLSNIIIFLIKKKKIKFIPSNWIKIYYKWLKNMNDWCISRQLWWGHNIPIYYYNDNIFLINNFKKNLIYSKFKKTLRLEKNVLDTWFSSALLPIISIKIFKKKFNFKNFIKSEILITGYDIIFYWVIRMIIFSLYFIKKLPFKKIYTHGLIRDIKGKKMSKSKGNIIDPLELLKNSNIKKLSYTKTYNIDILRFTLSSLININNDIKFNLEKFNNYNNLYKKLVNLTAFIIKICEIYKNFILINNINKNILYNKILDIWFLSQIENYKIFLYKNFKLIKINTIIKKSYKFIWNKFSKWYIELCKINLSNKSINKKYINCKIILTNYYNLIKLLHPIIPGLTQKIFNKIYKLLINYKILYNKNKFLILNLYPKINFLNINNFLNYFIRNYIIFIKNLRKINNKIINNHILSRNYKLLNIISEIKLITKIKNFYIIINKNYIKKKVNAIININNIKIVLFFYINNLKKIFFLKKILKINKIIKINKIKIKNFKLNINNKFLIKNKINILNLKLRKIFILKNI